ncbi:MAG TPA: FAD-dependent oxidoreductase, partial [Armatimonadota bacterium]|nr:FAD-dependent oxidoreductase [Armatimonadota bacterium]
MAAAAGEKKRVVILGGGFAGVYTAMYLEQKLGDRDDVEIALVNRENYLVYQPMLAEVVSGNVGILDTISPIRRLVKRTDLYVRDVQAVDLEAQTVTLSQGFRPRPYVIHYDHLVLATGSVTDFRGMPGLPEHAMPFKTLADAIHLRNHLIHVLEQAAIETDPELREQLLTFVVAGGGFSGTEVVAELNDFVRHVAKTYRKIDPKQIRVVLLHTGERVLDKEVSKDLSIYATEIL